MPHVELPQAEFKVVMLGDSYTGKTSLVLRFAEGYYRESARSATVGAFFITKRMQVHGITCKIQIWDTAGQEQFKPLAPMYYQHAAAAILCYDVTSPQSLRTLKYWLEELHCNVPAGRIVICMAATKMDLLPTHHDTLDAESLEIHQLHAEATQLAQDVGCLFVETSAKTNSNVTELFKVVAERVLQYQQTLKGKAALEIPVTRGGVMETSNHQLHASNTQEAPTTTPSRRRHSTPDPASTWNASPPMAYYSNHNDVNTTRSPFATPPLSAPSSKASSPIPGTNKQYHNHHHQGNGNYGYYQQQQQQYGGTATEQAPLPTTNSRLPPHQQQPPYYGNETTDKDHHAAAQKQDLIRSTATASPPTGAICGDDSNPMMCGVVLPSSSSLSNRCMNDHDYPHFGEHIMSSSSSSPTSCTIL